MAKTIIQTIGPLYGEVVNGTVFGRPNGSIYVPPVNTISASLVESYRYIRNNGANRILLCSSAGGIPWTATENHLKVVAQSQDSQNYIAVEIAKDSEFSEVIATRNLNAGIFNSTVFAFETNTTVESETTYYLRVILYASTGVAVATTATIEIEGVVVS